MLAGSEITPPTHPYLASHPLPTLTSRLLPAFTCAESRPQLHSSAHHCQRLPSSLLIENASEQFVAPSAPGPEAFPIKANDNTAKWFIVGEVLGDFIRHRGISRTPDRGSIHSY